MKRRAPESELPVLDWLLVESTRRLNTAPDRSVPDRTVAQGAADSGLPPAARLLQWARRLPGAAALTRRIEHRMHLLDYGLAGIWLFGLLAGGAAAAAITNAGQTIALSYALALLVGLPTLSLLLWVVLPWIVRAWAGRYPRHGGGLVGRIVMIPIRHLVLRSHGDDTQSAIAQALTALLRNRGRVLLGAVTHLFWLGYALGALLALTVRFLALRYDFSWESTLLGPELLTPWIQAIARTASVLPGVDAPGGEQIQALLADRSPADARDLWARLLLASVLLHALLPRLVLGAVYCWRWKRTRLPLDLNRPEYRQLLDAMDRAATPPAQRQGPPAMLPDHVPRAPRGQPGPGSPVAVGLELGVQTPPAQALPAGVRWLGNADSRAERKQLIERMRGLDEHPAEIVVVASMRRTPDRGAGAWLAELDAVAPVRLILAHSDRLEKDPELRDQRLADWQALAARYDLHPPETG
ncbi:MAG: hypothetical protein Kow0020_08640 [Wenzhouxiangellaceae bacterium]